jgi:hypothetical protein
MALMDTNQGIDNGHASRELWRIKWTNEKDELGQPTPTTWGSLNTTLWEMCWRYSQHLLATPSI